MSAQAFASLSLINLITNPLLIFCQALPSIFQAVACFERIETFCAKDPVSILPQRSPQNESTGFEHELTETRDIQAQGSSDRPLISFQHVEVCWSSDLTETILKDLTLEIHTGLTAIVGPIASGKSTLLETIIGETFLKGGSIQSNLSSGIAYCPQSAWIMNATIQHNFTGGADCFDQKWYDFCISCCCLKYDLEHMHHGDRSTAGNNGSSLSGGQRQRVVCRLPL